ncbi:hypothetical protein [Rhodobacter capsulatus]|uniref:hypothetical protein n=1 Tax=Rhodobacter capsulatus TaxID=1061 RepID=UPI00402621BC
MGYSTPKKQLDLTEFLAQPAASKTQIRRGISFRRPGARASGSTIAASSPLPAKDDTPQS